MRPDFSVRHSPRLTNRKGVPTRMAPPSTASSTSKHRRPCASCVAPHARPGRRRQRRPLRQAAADGSSRAAQRLAGQDEHEGEALQHQHRRVGQAQAPLQQAAGRAEAAEQDRHRDDRQRVVARDEATPGCRCSLARRSATRWPLVCTAATSMPPASPAQAPPSAQASDDQPVGRQPDQPRRARVAADHAQSRSPCVVKPSHSAGSQAQPPRRRPGPSARR